MENNLLAKKIGVAIIFAPAIKSAIESIRYKQNISVTDVEVDVIGIVE